MCNVEAQHLFSVKITCFSYFFLRKTRGNTILEKITWKPGLPGVTFSGPSCVLLSNLNYENYNIRNTYRARCYLNDYIDVERDEPHQEHHLGTVSNTITRGLKPVLWDPNPRPRSWCGSYRSF